MSTFNEFKPLDEKSLVEYIKETPSLSSLLGITDNLQIKEVGDGNLNFVYIIVSSSASLVIKQAIPYVRCIGESWPMTKERAYFEATALKKHGRLCPAHVPEVYHFDRTMSLIGMRYLEPPHIILRKGLIAGVEYPFLAEHMADYMSRSLFYTSLLYTNTTEHKREVAEFCGNVEMCRLTEQVVFSDPYKVSQFNRWTSPYLDQDAEAVRGDNDLKLEVAQLKSMFCERTQALIHGDLHTGSVMVTHDSTQVIDPEFAFYGPMGFDIGAFLGNLVLAFFAQNGHATQENDRKVGSICYSFSAIVLSTFLLSLIIFATLLRSLVKHGSVFVLITVVILWGCNEQLRRRPIPHLFLWAICLLCLLWKCRRAASCLHRCFSG